VTDATQGKIPQIEQARVVPFEVKKRENRFIDMDAVNDKPETPFVRKSKPPKPFRPHSGNCECCGKSFVSSVKEIYCNDCPNPTAEDLQRASEYGDNTFSLDYDEPFI